MNIVESIYQKVLALREKRLINERGMSYLYCIDQSGLCLHIQIKCKQTIQDEFHVLIMSTELIIDLYLLSAYPPI
jgi:hypothetical protein